jgi:hypothetical protein
VANGFTATLRDQRDDEVAIIAQPFHQVGLERAREGGHMDLANPAGIRGLRRPDQDGHANAMSGASSAFMPMTL